MSVTGQIVCGMTACGQQTTPFGAIENPQLPKSLPHGTVVRVDTLACLKQVWGENILMSRQHLYRLVSGCVSDKEFRKLVASYYKRYAAFANYVDEKYIFADQSVPLLVRIIKPARELIADYSEKCSNISTMYGGKYLGTHADYNYYLFQGEYLPKYEECCLC